MKKHCDRCGGDLVLERWIIRSLDDEHLGVNKSVEECTSCGRRFLLGTTIYVDVLDRYYDSWLVEIGPDEYAGERIELVFPWSGVGDVSWVEPKQGTATHEEVETQAKGRIWIPEGCQAKLTVSTSGAGSLAFLDDLLALALHTVVCHNDQTGDTDLVHVGRLERLRVLDLQDTGVSDAGLAHLLHLRHLEVLDLRGTAVTSSAAARLHDRLPQCRIELGDGMVLTAEPWGACQQCGRRMTVTRGPQYWCRWCEDILVPLGSDETIGREWRTGEELLGRFEVREVLYSGGMSEVYRVHHLEWDVEFAVKSPRAGMAADTWLRPVEEWLSLLPHPHVVTGHFVRRLGGIPRVFTEFVDGGTLAEWLDDGRLYAGGEAQALERILAVATGTANGLGHLHDGNLLHLGFGSSSVLMTRDGVAKVGGMSLLTHGVSDERTEEVLGTPVGMRAAYCSPEQADAVVQAQSGVGSEDGMSVTQRSDVWSWAATVLEMFVGERTWSHGQAASAALDSYLEEGPVREGPPRMPESAADLVRRCLQVDPFDRPGSIAKVAGEVAGIRRERFMHDSIEDLLGDLLGERSSRGVEIPGYELGRLLGTHGMGRVFEATRGSDGRRVAIEVARFAGASAHVVGRLYGWAVDLADGLDHPNLVRVLDHGFEGGYAYLVTEYWLGETVASVMDNSGGRLAVEQATPIISGALDGLVHLHEHGIVHRDLKPLNIWLTEDGVAKLTGFDFAKRCEDGRFADPDAWPEPVSGTLMFIPREQVIGYSNMKPVSDVWAMAATFYNMLTGVYPRDFTPGGDWINVILNEPVIPIRQRASELPERLAAVIDRALSEDVAERYHDAAEFREALGGCCDGFRVLC